MDDDQARDERADILRRLDELDARLDALDDLFDAALRRVKTELYDQLEAGLDEVARHLDGLASRLDAPSGPPPGPWSDSAIDAEVRARLVDPPAAVDPGVVTQLVRDELRRVVDTVSTVAREVVAEAERLRAQQDEFTATMADREIALQRSYVGLIVDALDEALGGLATRQRKRLAKEVEDSFGHVARAPRVVARTDDEDDLPSEAEGGPDDGHGARDDVTERRAGDR